jgi:hypothetical protein
VVFIGGHLAVGLAAPDMALRFALEESENDIGIACVDGEKHLALIFL